jgi:glycosyltransferase involved in cell wall biosynthesis
MLQEGSTGNSKLRLLFLAYYFPPVRAIACVRTWNVTKYLAKLGWDITIVTPCPSVWKHVDTPKDTDLYHLNLEGSRLILTDHQWRCLMPEELNCWNQGLGWLSGGVCRKIARALGIDRGIGWIKQTERACSTLAAKDVDVIFASGPPFVTFRLAKRLSDRLGRPYVLDYRDLWTGNPHAPHPARPATVKEEARLLAGCEAVTVVSRSLGHAMDQLIDLKFKLQVITNGYDPDELADIKPYDFGHFAIVYTGSFYPPKRVITPVMAALQRLKGTPNGTKSEWYFHYYGTHESHVREEARRFGMLERVVLHGSVPRLEALSAVRGASMAVVITSVAEEASLEDRGIVTGKVFEALGLRVPILLIAPPHSDIEAVAATTALARCFSGSDTDGMVSFLLDAMRGRVYEPRNFEAYTWPNIAKRLDTVLRRASKSPLVL